MQDTIKSQPFDATTVALTGSNLVEASAGTGKTYSIAILVVRLILEKKISISEILMVTFTKAAVAELEERIRLFVRQAYKTSLGEKIEDLAIEALVVDSITRSSKIEVQVQLRNAVFLLDETSVLTIHSFCQATLIESAFETNQLFSAEALEDSDTVITEEVNNFWRENVTTIPTGLLKLLIAADLSRNSIQEVVKHHLNGKRYSDYEQNKDYTWCEEDHEKIIKELHQIKEQVNETGSIC